MRLSFSKHKKATGLAATFDREPGYDLNLLPGYRQLGHVAPLWDRRGHISGEVTGWYWSVGTYEELGIQWRNTAHHPVHTVEVAKSQCLAYVKECLMMKGLLK